MRCENTPKSARSLKRVATDKWRAVFTSRWLHAGSLAVVLGVTFWLLWTYDSARENAVVVFGVIGTAATFFGLLIALIEILRLGNMAAIAQERVEEALSQLERERKAASAAECKVLIESALDVLDASGKVPSATILRISRNYRSLVNDGPDEEQPKETAHVEILDSYVMLDPRQTAKIKLIKATLIAMAHNIRSPILRETK